MEQINHKKIRHKYAQIVGNIQPVNAENQKLNIQSTFFNFF